MRKIVCDTSFMVSAVGNKIDIFDELFGYTILIPNQVVEELENMTKSKKKLKFRNQAELAIKLIDKSPCKKIDIGKGHVDKRIIHFAKENPLVIVATLDKEIKQKLKNKNLVIRGKKKLEII